MSINNLLQTVESNSVLQIHLDKYKEWLQEQNMSPHTRRAYFCQVQQFVTHIECSNQSGINNLHDNQVFATIVREYRDFLKHILKVSSSSINNSLIAIDRFCTFLGIENLKIEREKRAWRTTNKLSPEEQEQFLLAVKKQGLIRDQALSLVLICAGVRIAQCASLNVSDIHFDQNGAYLLLKNPASSCEQQMQDRRNLNAAATEALKQWLVERNKFITDNNESALWVNQQGHRLSIPGIDFIIRRIGWAANLTLSVELLRQTGIANMTKSINKNNIDLLQLA